MNTFKYSSDNKRYHTLHYYNMHKFGERVYKAPINAGFSCPNIDGTKGVNGCIYCDGGSGYFTDDCSVSVTQQLEHQISLIHKKHPNAKINAYFQPYTNTYAPVEVLKERYEPVLSFPDVKAISIATRPDCLPEDVVAYLTDLSSRIDLTVELGLQSIDDRTAEIICRGHTFDEFTQGFENLKAAGIRTVVHIINGLPNETKDMMLETAYRLGKMKPDGIKIHLLHVIQHTELERMYYQHDYIPMTMEDYVSITVKQLEYIPAETVIERLTGDGDKSKLVAPMWSADKIAVLGAIDQMQVQLDTYQGKKYKY